jgi:hypothetical protein
MKIEAELSAKAAFKGMAAYLLAVKACSQDGPSK